MLSLARYCTTTFYNGEDVYPEGSERDDLEKVESLLSQLASDKHQRATLKDECWHQAQQLLSAYSLVVQELARKLVKHKTLDGKEAHQMIWQMTGYPETDWRLQVLGIKRERK